MKRNALYPLILLLGVGCTAAPSAPAPQSTEDFLKGLAQIHLIGPLADCLKPALNAAQKQYLIDEMEKSSKQGKINTYKIQRYLMALASTDRQAACQQRAVQVCERVTPGQCIAQPD